VALEVEGGILWLCKLREGSGGCVSCKLRKGSCGCVS
jgi:hypothetical protein